MRHASLENFSKFKNSEDSAGHNCRPFYRGLIIGEPQSVRKYSAKHARMYIINNRLAQNIRVTSVILFVAHDVSERTEEARCYIASRASSRE